MQLNPDLLLDALSLKINSDKDSHKKLVNDFISIMDENKNGNVGIAESYDAVSQLYLNILKDIAVDEISSSDKLSMTTSLLKYEASPVVQKDPTILSTLRALFDNDTKLSEKKIDRLASKISSSINLYVASKYIRKMFKKQLDGENARDPEIKSNIVDAIINDSRELTDVLIDNKNSLEQTVADRYLERVDMNDKEDIKKAIKQYRKRATHVFKTGLQGLNKMFGKAGGFKLGESITINALKHNYKSGLLMSFAKWIITHNRPAFVDPENPGQPTILFITLENEANENIMWWFESMYVAIHGSAPKDISDDEIVENVYDFFKSSGYSLIIERKLGPDFGYEEYKQMYERYQKEGRRILVTIIDYMNMMKKSTDKNGRSDLGLRDLYNKMCNFNKNRMTTQISAHQLNRDAARLVTGSTNVVKKFNDSHYADGMDVGREVDMEIFIHIERNNQGKAFLTMQRGKHRYVNNTPEKDKYCAYQFGEYGIDDDLDTESRAVRNIYAEDADAETMINNIKSDITAQNTQVVSNKDEVF